MGRDLTEAEETTALFVITSVQQLIAECLSRDSEWADALDPIPETLRNICVEKAILAIVNPNGLESQTETLGAYSHTERFTKSGAGAALSLALNASERARARRAVDGTHLASLRTPSAMEQYLEEYGS